ncbi:polysaccharide biosynthesis tyrosine autokinase [Paraferrimonas sedimenticola]|uniref:Tyrosine protein kinase n=1 Tax=Paraferrimonas sedimenticola TaxID=375674 RepID=A0AA37RYA0_9GAMM|nr:polysaccharide biosynthesis tyrosine autokinase [Paraferrimonas sedimenticola]GLP96892.1 tyrosine protein kinase [Paraferrimonas sedimenticola]
MTSNTNDKSSRSLDNDEIDLGKLLAILLNGKWIIMATTFVFALLAVAYAMLATPIYKADALIQIEEKKGGLPGLADLGEMFATDGAAVTEIELLKSRQVIGNAVDELKLDIIAEPKRFPLIGNFLARRHGGAEPADAMLEGYGWGGERINVSQLAVERDLGKEPLILTYLSGNKYQVAHGDKVIIKGELNQLAESALGDVRVLVTDLVAQPNTQFVLTKKSRVKAIRDLQGILAVSEKGKQSGILALSLDGADRQLTVKTLDAIANYYVLQNVRRMSAEAEKSLEFLKDQLPTLKIELTESEERLNDYRLANKSVDLSLETQSVLEQLVNLESRISELAFSEADIARRFTPEHPNYVAFKRKQQELFDERERLQEQVTELPETQQEVLRLARDVEVNQQIYLALLNKVQELNVAKAGTVGNVRVIDYAEISEHPVKPKKALIAVLGTLLGGMLSVAFVLVRAAMNRGVENPEEFEEIGINVYASVPFSETFFKRFESNKKRKKHKQSLLLAHYDPTDLAIEAIRSLRTSLHFAMLEAKNKVIMISGPSPEIGKSFISANLATTIAQSGQKVLVIDADMRKGYMQRLFNMNWDDGLSDMLVGDVSYEDAIKETEVEGLHFMPRGRIPPNPSELLMHPSFAEFIERANKEYDMVIVDTPPILAVTDANIVGHLCGTNLMVTRFGINPLKQVEVAQRRFEQNGVDIKGVIFNGVEKKAGGYGYEYGYYSYEYKNKSA